MENKMELFTVSVQDGLGLITIVVNDIKDRVRPVRRQPI